jgi:hypothetical protein
VPESALAAVQPDQFLRDYAPGMQLTNGAVNVGTRGAQPLQPV